MSDLLQKAAEATTQGARDYDPPEVNFKRIALLWSAYLQGRGIEITITPKDVALMMVLFKTAREIGGTKTDNLVDMIGYTLCAEKL